VYIKYCAVCLKRDYTLRCLEYICPVSLPLSSHGFAPLGHHKDTDKCTLTFACLTKDGGRIHGVRSSL